MCWIRSLIEVLQRAVLEVWLASWRMPWLQPGVLRVEQLREELEDTKSLWNLWLKKRRSFGVLYVLCLFQLDWMINRLHRSVSRHKHQVVTPSSLLEIHNLLQHVRKGVEMKVSKFMQSRWGSWLVAAAQEYLSFLDHPPSSLSQSVPACSSDRISFP